MNWISVCDNLLKSEFAREKQRFSLFHEFLSLFVIKISEFNKLKMFLSSLSLVSEKNVTFSH